MIFKKNWIKIDRKYKKQNQDHTRCETELRSQFVINRKWCADFCLVQMSMTYRPWMVKMHMHFDWFPIDWLSWPVSFCRYLFCIAFTPSVTRNFNSWLILNLPAWPVNFLSISVLCSVVHTGSLYLSLKPKFKTLVWNQISVWNQT